METAVSYSRTIKACYLGHICSAIVINITPVLFFFLMGFFDLNISVLGTLVFINFITQVLINLIFAKLIDKTGFRSLIIIGNGFAAAGLILYAVLPFIFTNIFAGFILATIVFSIGGGLYQLLLSPIVNSIPSEEKSAAMTKLHAFYAWGQILTVLVTTLTLFLITSFISKSLWYLIPLMWCFVPLSCLLLFAFVPLPKPVKDSNQGDFKKIVLNPFFIFALIGIFLFGATEIIVSQWSSTYIESVIKMDKILGDIMGVCIFAFMIGFGRIMYGKFSKKINLSKIMTIGVFCAFILYIVIALSPFKVLSIMAFGLCGLSVSLLWPGMLSITSEKFTNAGSWIFAILTAVGNLGSALGPFILGQIGENFPSSSFAKDLASNLSITPLEIGLRAAVLICSLFPLCAFIVILHLHKKRMKTNMLDANSLNGQKTN